MKAFNSLSTFWKVVIIIIIILIIIYFYKKSKSKVTQLTQASNIVLLPGEPKDIPSNTQIQIQGIGKELYNDIEDTSFWTGHYYLPYEQALQLTDNQLAYLADYYYTFLTNSTESLYSAIDSQVYTTSNEPAKLQARLAAIGKR